MLYSTGIGKRQSNVPPEHAVAKPLYQLDDLLRIVVCLFPKTGKIICHWLTKKLILGNFLSDELCSNAPNEKEIVVDGRFLEELEVRSSHGTTQGWCCMLCINSLKWLLCHPWTRMFSCFWLPTFHLHNVNNLG